MILYIFVAFYAIANGFTFADDEICSESLRSVCFSRRAEAFPTTAEELEETCNIVIKGLQCGFDYGERCHSNSGFLPDGYKLLETFHEICDSRTPLHRAVVNNLKCFNDNRERMSNECTLVDPLEETTLELQAAELLAEGFEVEVDERVHPDKYFCLRGLNEISCMAAVTERECGTTAMDAFVEIVQKLSSPLFVSCSDHLKIMLPSVIRMTTIENEIEEALKRRKK